MNSEDTTINHRKTHIHKYPAQIMTCAVNQEIEWHSITQISLFKRSLKPTTDGEGGASSQTESQTPSQNQTNLLKICLRQARPNRISVDCIKHQHKGHKRVTWMSQTKLSLFFRPQFEVWRSGCRSTEPISLCLCLKSIQTFRPSSNHRYPTISAKSSLGSHPAGEHKPPLPRSTPPSIPPSSPFSVCCVNLVTTTTGIFMFLQEMKFDMALKGTASCVTPGPLKATQTPQEQIKNASSLIWSDICFFSEFKEGCFFFFWSYKISIPSVHLPGKALLPLILLSDSGLGPLFTWMAKREKPPSGCRQPKPHYFMKDVWKPCKYLGLE